MNVKKIPKFIYFAAFFLIFFSFAHFVNAYEIRVLDKYQDGFWYPSTYPVNVNQSETRIISGESTLADFPSFPSSVTVISYITNGGNDFYTNQAYISNSLPDGSYYLAIWNTHDSPYTVYYYPFFIISGSMSLNENTNPRIDTFDFSTTTAKVTITGYWEATTTPYITQRLTFWQYSDTLGEESREQLIATTTGRFNWTFDFRDPYAWTSGQSSTTPIYSNFTLNASLDTYDETNYVFPYGGEEITNIDATSTMILTTQYNSSDFTENPRNLALYPEYECGISSIIGCIKNALIWTFYPTQSVLDSWENLKETLKNKAPIGYFYSVKNSVSSLSATSTPKFSLTIPANLKQYFFDPLDAGISSILWVFFIFHFYKRLKHIQI